MIMMTHLRLAPRLILPLILFSTAAYAAAPLKFPEAELPRETVLPVFDKPDVVLNRSVVTAKRFEIGVFGGWTPTDPFFNPFSYGANVGYHFTENHGLNILGSQRLGGNTQYTDQLNNLKGTTPLRLENAPNPQYLLLANYQLTAYYGKMSFSKETVGHLSLFGTIGGGVFGVGGEALPVLALGVGQKYYITADLGLRLDVRLLTYNGPYDVSKDLRGTTKTVANSQFDKKILFDTMLTLGAIYMIPGS